MGGSSSNNIGTAFSDPYERDLTPEQIESISAKLGSQKWIKGLNRTVRLYSAGSENPVVVCKFKQYCHELADAKCVSMLSSILDDLESDAVAKENAFLGLTISSPLFARDFRKMNEWSDKFIFSQGPIDWAGE